MKLLLKPFLLSLLLFTVSCTEEISQELEDAVAEESNSDSNNDRSTSLTDRKFRIVNKNPESLSHYLHKEGDAIAPCEISPPEDGWEPVDYERATATDCILEVEEQDLYRSGAKLEVSIDPGLCEYVTYEPMRFANYQPGISNKMQFSVSCDTTCSEVSSTLCNNIEGNLYASFSDLNDVNNNGSVNLDTNASIFPFYNELTSGSLSCEFDHSGEDGPNCDSGAITTRKYELRSYASDWCEINGVRDTNSRTFNPSDDNYCERTGEWDGDNNVCEVTIGSTTTTVSRSESLCAVAGTHRTFDCQRSSGSIQIVQNGADEVNSCGGDAVACFSGPGIDAVDDPSRSGGIIVQNGSVDSVSIPMDFAAPFDKGFESNKYLASYQRICVNDEDKGAVNYFSSGAGSFNGEQVELRARYVGHENLNGLTGTHSASFGNFPSITVDSNSDGVDDYTVYGTNPFASVMGGSDNPALHSKQYYAVKCYDQAFDLKSQIRIHIREWDRGFSLANSDLMESISDVDSTPALSRLLDNSELLNQDQPWNDQEDWDDFFVASSIYSDDNCRELVEHPAKGTCMRWDGTGSNVNNDWVSYNTATNKEDCIAAFDAGTIHKCSDQTSTDRTSCLDAGEVWMGTNWISNDNSSENFPGSI